MNKKQAVIILTLLVLIICAGVIATKMNDNLYVNVDGAVKTTETQVGSAAKVGADYFAENKLLKTTVRNTAIATFKSLAESKDISLESRNSANAKAIKCVDNSIAESKIEADLKSKGFGDAICWIEDDKAPAQVRISIKAKDAKEKLTDIQIRSIGDSATTLSHIKALKIDLKQ